jgi:hypothetical protein
MQERLLLMRVKTSILSSISTSAHCIGLLLISVAFSTNFLAADATQGEARRPLREIAGEEREAKFKEMQEKFGPAPFTFEELRKMPPEERQAKLRQWREGRFTFSPEERQKRRLQINQRLTRQIAELEKRKAAGNLTDDERLRLDRLHMIASRFNRVARPPQTVLGAPASGSNTVGTAKKQK